MILRAALVTCLAASVAYADNELVCPDDARPAGETTPDVREAWCEADRDGAVVMHGPYRAWWPNGALGTSGQYELGKMVGKWTGWFPNGKRQGEQWFEDGKLVRERYWNEQGRPIPKPPASEQ